MKEPELPAINLEVNAEQQEQKKVAFIGRIKPCAGHICFEYEIATGEIKPAVFMEPDTVNYGEFVKTRSIQKKVLVKPGFLYVTALNKENAGKKFQKMI